MYNGKKLLIVESLGLGDVILKTPFMKAMKKAYPNISISFATKPNQCDILRRLPYVDTIYEYKHGGGFFQKWKFALALKGYDYIIFRNVSEQLLLAAKVWGIPNVFGVGKEKYVARGILKKNYIDDAGYNRQYAAKTFAEKYFELLEIKLAPDYSEIDISMPDAHERENVNLLLERARLLNKEYICMAPFASDRLKAISVECAREIVFRIEHELHMPVVIIGGSSDARDAETLGARCILAGKTTLMEMVEVIRRAKLFLGMDSGPMHVAGALHVPILALFTWYYPSQWLPLNRNAHAISIDLPCKPCRLLSEATLKCVLKRRCVFDITADKVMEALRAHEALGLQKHIMSDKAIVECETS